MRKFIRNLVLTEEDKVKLSEKSFKVRRTKPIGSSGTEIYSGYFYEEYLDTLRGYERAKLYDKMRRSDTQIKMNLSAVKNPIKSANWFIKNPDNEDERMRYMTEFVEFVVFKDMENPWSKFLRESLTMVDNGNALFEITHKVVLNHPIYGSYNGIRSLDWRSPKTIERWNVDPESGRLVSVEQYAYGDLERTVTIPAEDLLLFAIDVEGSNYEGISMLRACYGPWIRKQESLKLNMIGIEKFAIPTPLVKMPDGFAGTEGYDDLIDSLEDYVVHENNYLAYPDGLKIDLNTNVYDPEKVEKTIQNEDLRMAKAFLANFLELGTGGSGGAYALSNDLSDFFLSGIEHIASEITEKFNRSVVFPLIDMNFGKQDKYPELCFSGITDKAGKEFAEMLNSLAQSQVIKPDASLEKFVREKMNLPEISEEDQREVVKQNPLSLSERIIKAAYGD